MRQSFGSVFGAGGLNLDPPGRELGFDPALDEDLDQQFLTVALERQAIALLDDDARRVRAGSLGEFVERRRVGILDGQRQERRPIAFRERLFEARDQLLDRVGRCRGLPRNARGEREARQRQEKANGHGWSHIRPLRGDSGAQGRTGAEIGRLRAHGSKASHRGERRGSQKT